MSLRVLLVEDNIDIAENISDYLCIHGHIVDFAYDGLMAIELVAQQGYDIIIMDIMMPKLDGLSTIKRLREQALLDIPIIVLTAKDTLEDKLTGFDSGADDYVVKPFAMQELHARMTSLIRRHQKSYQHILHVQGITLDQQQQRAEIDNTSLKLNPTTFKIMWLLTLQFPNVVTKQHLQHSLWADELPDNDILRSHMYNLRKALAACSKDISIVSHHGRGYQLCIQRETA
ncbi:hypothetical protein PA25_25370 [Pseudoalteromonas sp. A25]|uniref:response regulator transcription factor n=1 Tax=Pseudoalteromonas sp. A25 TaxID=116092 RepID=UPI0012A0E539|nr:response regulator transcription factor [Pseudoalteromonas sp. A25]BBN82552.1 hypothetical protein PA25_25370 [Pseudoalteromonas sp. A25]